MVDVDAEHVRGRIEPARIWSRIGRRPLIAGGNANGDVRMLDFPRRGGTGLALLIHHDDDTGRGDWSEVFPAASSA